MRLSHEYLAGLFDGEGCITAGYWAADCRTPEGKARFRVLLTNTYLPILEMVRRQYGGHIFAEKQWNPKWATRYAWSALADVAARFLIDAEPYLIIKREQANAFLIARETYSDTLVSTPGRGGSAVHPIAARIRLMCLRKLQQLNLNGPKLGEG